MAINLIRITFLTILLFQYVGVMGRSHDSSLNPHDNHPHSHHHHHHHEGYEHHHSISNKHRRRDLYAGTKSANSINAITAETQNNTEVIAQVGGTASIRCYTHFHGDEVVTWLKKDEDIILTAGGQVYSSESRYSVVHARHQKMWELLIREVRPSDAGLYECQLATYPFTSLFFTLKVVEARAVISGGPEVHIQTGNHLLLHCSIKLATEPPVYIFWFHNDSMVNYDSSRPLEVIKLFYASTLAISKVTWSDAGVYRCEPHNAVPANITVHVVEGEKQAALYKGQKEGASSKGGTASSVSPSAVISGSSYILMLLLLLAYSHLTECGVFIQPPRGISKSQAGCVRNI